MLGESFFGWPDLNDDLPTVAQALLRRKADDCRNNDLSCEVSRTLQANNTLQRVIATGRVVIYISLSIYMKIPTTAIVLYIAFPEHPPAQPNILCDSVTPWCGGGRKGGDRRSSQQAYQTPSIPFIGSGWAPQPSKSCWWSSAVLPLPVIDDQIRVQFHGNTDIGNCSRPSVQCAQPMPS